MEQSKYVVVTGKDLITSGWDEIGRVLTLVSPFIFNGIYRINRIDSDEEYECIVQSNCRPVLETETIVELNGKMYLATESDTIGSIRVFNQGKLPNKDNKFSYNKYSLLPLNKVKIVQQGKLNNNNMELKTTKERVLEAAKICSTVKEALKTLFPEVFEEEFKPLSIRDRIWVNGAEIMIAQIDTCKLILIDIKTNNRKNGIIVEVVNPLNISLVEINELLGKEKWRESMRMQ